MEKIIKNVRVIHIIGIGGAGTSGLAKIFNAIGKKVQGSDMRKTSQTEFLENLGIKVFYGHSSDNIDKKIDLVIRSQAINPDNPEFLRAKQLNIPVITYPRALGLLMHEKKGIAVAGTHGKTTTSAMTVFMLKHAGYDPDFVIGGEICGYGNSGVGKGNFLVVEACEYKRSFLNLEPEVGIITSIEEDHLDYYRDLNDIKNAFEDFSERIKPGGNLIGMIDDPVVASVLTRSGSVSTGYGLEHGDVVAENVRFLEEGNRFDCYYKGEKLGEVFTPVYGKHNVLNALAVICTGIVLNIPFSQIVDALEKFPGVLRRSQLLACVNDIYIIDDYGHHPTEIIATLKGLRQRFPSRRIIAIFQPHQYSRTRFLLKDFASSFALADEVIVPDIYFVRDTENEKQLVNSEMLVNKIIENGTQAQYIRDFDYIVDYLAKNIKPGNIVLTIGAGPIYEVGLKLKEVLMK
ncbi:MAG TPA: UDP-N-acetylmuramate--L-alanine ligase [bacterium]|nr:UDP-N-acetylmuramate--L-alanine ligase [bacterium]HOL35415.1 UDP-N-acetylmuramate--L-alanine ligase [bacterium]HPP08806.1 UDP-N-acetylmuramate--L-alanine ligase [bacterium]